jgi:16S rRNA (cytosine1402-N4)-methyltransferase
LSYIGAARGGWFLDGTVGTGGHGREILAASEQVKLIGLDCDESACERTKKVLADFGNRAVIVNENFVNIKQVLENLRVDKLDGILLDLGVSSEQLDNAELGFSFMKDGPLDMRMDRRLSTRAKDLVAGLGERELYKLFKQYGEERFSRKIAREIGRSRQRGMRFERTLELADLIRRVIPRRSKIDPATRVFQALRIAVNRELDKLNQFLSEFDKYLRQGGRIVCISYHSLEDRLVKVAFREKKREGLIRVLTGKPVVPGREEIQKNPRARSAKLRAAEKL